MNDADLWLQWWACAWHHAHPHWPALVATPAELRSLHAGASSRFGITPCLPCPPAASLRQLALAPLAQHDAWLQRIGHICRPTRPTALDATERLWCQRLGKALRPQGWLEPGDDVLQLLRAWVEPAVWQRLRLRFAPARIQTLEQKPLLALSAAKLQTLWQTVLWHTRLTVEGSNHAVTSHP